MVEILNAIKTTGTGVFDPGNGLTKPRINVDLALVALGVAPGNGVLEVTPAGGLAASGPTGGPFTPVSRTFTLSNTGSDGLDFAVSTGVPWADAVPDSGTLQPGGATEVVVSIGGTATALTTGNFVSSINLANTTNGNGDTSRSGVLTIEAGVGANDKFDDALVLSQSAGVTAGSSAGASKEAGEPSHAEKTGGASVWWVWTAPGTGSVTFDTFGSAFDTLLGAYTGNNVSALQEETSNDDTSGQQSEISFNTVGGQTYYIAVDGNGGAGGNITLNWDFSQDSIPQPPIAVTPNSSFVSQGAVGGPFNPASIDYTLTNVSTETQSFTVGGVPSWLTASVTAGVLGQDASTTVSIVLQRGGGYDLLYRG